MSTAVSFDDLFSEETCVGQGMFGKVCKVKTKPDYVGLPVGTVVAVKLINQGKLDEDQLELLENEVSILRTVSAYKDNSCHRNIVCYYGTVNVIKNRKPLFGIVMEFIDGYKLDDFIETLVKMKVNPDTNAVYESYDILSVMTSEQIANLMKQLLLTLDYIHSLGIVHRDIKSGNIMYIPNQKIVKYIDFGFSCFSTVEKVESQCKLTPRGTPDYVSPETWEIAINQIEGYPKTEDQVMQLIKSDIWSLGIVFYELLYGSGPFSHTLDNMQIAREVMSDQPVPFPDFAGDQALKQVVEMLLIKDYKLRPTARTAYEFLESKFPSVPESKMKMESEL